MNTDNKVFEKLFSAEKTELASQRYEFAGKDISQIDSDVDKILTSFTKSRNIAQEKMIDYKLSYKTYEKQISDLKSSAIQLEGDLENVASALASMGISGNGVEGFQKAKTKVNILMKAIQDGESSLSKFKSPIN
jgi:hypothetical protein